MTSSPAGGIRVGWGLTQDRGSELYRAIYPEYSGFDMTPSSQLLGMEGALHDCKLFLD